MPASWFQTDAQLSAASNEASVCPITLQPYPETFNCAIILGPNHSPSTFVPRALAPKSADSTANRPVNPTSQRVISVHALTKCQIFACGTNIHVFRSIVNESVRIELRLGNSNAFVRAKNI